MKKYPAIALVEFKDIAAGIHATDAMLKKAPISFVKCGIISQGRYLTLIGGSTASVEESYAEALAVGKDSVIDRVILPDVHPQLHDGLLGKRSSVPAGAIAIIETDTVSSNIRAAEQALKGTPIDLLEIRLADSWLSGKGVSIYRGALPDIQAAVNIAVTFLRDSGVAARHRIIPRPHDALVHELESSAYFMESDLLDTGGEAR